MASATFTIPTNLYNAQQAGSMVAESSSDFHNCFYSNTLSAVIFVVSPSKLKWPLNLDIILLSLLQSEYEIYHCKSSFEMYIAVYKFEVIKPSICVTAFSWL